MKFKYFVLKDIKISIRHQPREAVANRIFIMKIFDEKKEAHEYINKFPEKDYIVIRGQDAELDIKSNTKLDFK